MADQRAPRVVMIPVDASERCEEVFNWYVDNVRQEGDKLLVYYCHEFHMPAFPMAMATDEWRQFVTEDEIQVKALEAKYKAKCEAVPTSAKIKVQSGSPGHMICECAKEESADLIVIGTRGLGTIRRTVMGSVSDYVLHHCHVPVVVVPKLTK